MRESPKTTSASVVLPVLTALLVACGSKDQPAASERPAQPKQVAPTAGRPKRWSEIEAIAAATVPHGASASLEPVLERIADAGTPDDDALEKAIAWSVASGGLPDRDLVHGRPVAVELFKLGRGLIERRGSDPKAVFAALYLGMRLRKEGRDLLACVAGVELADQVRVLHNALAPSADEVGLAPTRKDILRGIAANAVWLLSQEELPDSNETRAIVEEFVLHAPEDRIDFLRRFRDAEQRTTSLGSKGSLGGPPDAESRVARMLDQVDAYQAWIAEPATGSE